MMEIRKKMTREPNSGNAGSRTNPSDESSNSMERAFEMARSGSCGNVQEIRDRLRKEGFSGVESHLSGIGFRRQLRASIKASRPAEPAQDTGPSLDNGAGGLDGAKARTGA